MRQALLLNLILLLAGSALAQPVANFTASPTSGCAPMVVSFTSTSTGSPTGYSWTFGFSGAGGTSTAQNPIVPYTVSGTYTVTLTVSNASGSNTKTQTGYIVVKQVPVVTFSASPTSVCPGDAINFTSSITWNASGTGNYYWDFGDGGSSPSANPSHSYVAGGSYTVKLTATNSVGCPSTDTQANFITVTAAPVADFSASDTAICALSGTTTFTSTTTGSGTLSYVWDFGDGSPPSTATSPTHAYTTAGSYTVRLIATNAAGCSDTETKSTYIRVRVVNAGFAAPPSACAGASVSVASGSSTTTGAAVNWNFGDGSPTASGSSATHTYTTAGSYTITQSVSIGGCTAIATNSITINPKPSPSFTFSPTAPCPAIVNVQFNTSAVSGVTYNWFFGDGFSGSGTSPSHFYTWSDTFTVTLNAYNSFGCAGSFTQNVIILPMKLFAKADKREGCAPLSISFHDSLITYDDYGVPSPYPYSIASYQWSFGDASTSFSAAPTHIYSNPGSYVVQLTVTTSNGCTITDTIHVRAGNHTLPAFGASPRIVCVNTPVFFVDSSTSSGLPINAWQWDFGDGGGSPFQNPTYPYTLPGTYTVTLHVGVNGCWDSLQKLNYIVVNFPKSVITYQVSCNPPRLVQFGDSSIGATSHIWYFGDGTTSTTANPLHQYTTAGLYQVSLVSFNSATGCRDSAVSTINLYPATLSISALDTTICKGDTLRLTSVVGGGAVASEYSWWIGTGSSSPAFSYPSTDLGNKNVLITAGGSYHIALEIKDQNHCKTSVQRRNYITVGAPAVLFKAAPPVGCIPYAFVSLKDTTTYPGGTFGVTRVWDFGDGTGATTTAPTIIHPYTTTGSYGISLKVTDNIGCMDSLSIPNYLIVSNPRAVFSTSGTNACIGVPFTFFSSSTGNGLTYQWSFGDGGTSTASSPAHAYATAGTYTVRLIVSDNVGCRDTATKASSITVNIRPHAAFTMDDTINVCPPLIVNFTNASTGAVRYNWSFGTGATSTLTNPSNTYTLPQVYTVRLVATNVAGCSDTAYGRARILGYAGVLSYAPLKGCAPFTVSFRANNVDGVAGFIYDFGDGTTAATTAAFINHVYTKPGPHVPAITLTDNLGCFVTSAGIDTIKVDGVFAGFTFSPFPACDKGTIQFIDTSHGAYSALNPPSWRFHDGSTSSLASPTKAYIAPGTYAVTLYSSTVAGCLDTFKSKVIFHALPHINAGPDTTICLTDSAILKPAGGVSYTWSPAATLSCSACTNPGAFPTLQTQYVVVGMDTNGCTNRDSVTVHIRTKTTGTVSPGTEICSGEKTTLAAAGGGTYDWSPPTGLSDPHSANPVASPTTTQHYTVITKLSACIPDTDYVDVVVHPTPVVEAGKDQVMIAGNSVELKAEGSAFITRWEWTPTAGLSCTTCAAPEAAPKRSTTYIITASTEFDCHATDSLHVTVLCDNNQVYLPNTFTPDGNGVNDVFYPRGRGIETISHFRIYDRWGEVVFERSNMAVDDKQQGWDGRKNGRLLSPDIYVYTVEAICDTGEPIKWQGDVLLLR